MLYPEKSLLTLLSAPEVTTPAQLRYLEILVHLRNDDADLTFILARSYLAVDIPDKAEQALAQLRGVLSPKQAKTALSLHYEVHRQFLKRLRPGDTRWTAVQQEYARQVELLVQAGAKSAELSRYHADARSMGDTATSRRLELLLQKRADNITSLAARQDAGEAKDEVSAIRSDYRSAAAIQFQNMQKASRTEKRRFFLAGVKTLQSGNLLNEALTAADRYLNGLSDDRETLIYLSRLALAANRPERAQQYIRRALGMTDKGGSGS
jgi:hypothetical protein